MKVTVIQATSRLFDSIVISPIEDNMRRFRLLQPIEVIVDIDGKPYVFKVPAGFQTDFASVPRWLHGLVPPMGKYALAALVHDYLYRYGEVSRREADAVFWALSEYGKYGKWRSWLLYLVVRVLGWIRYNSDPSLRSA